MIGVICKSRELKVVEEFFQLFKTPWEQYDANREYDVVLCTEDTTAELNAKLVVVYGSEQTRSDRAHGLVTQIQNANVLLKFDGSQVPIYGTLSTFAAQQSERWKGSSEIVTVKTKGVQGRILRVGYDLFDEIFHLLSVGQPPENARIPTLELHIEMLRSWILGSGIALIEIPPVPPGYDFIGCLTHDVDFVKISNHKFNHTMWGFVYRALAGSLSSALRGRIPWGRLWQNVRALLSLPLVYMGLRPDFWLQFENYFDIEQGLRSTYFFIPFKGLVGDKVPMPSPERRAARYDIRDMQDWANRLLDHGCEVGVHGIDAWHDAARGRRERDAVAEVVPGRETGVRMHWLCFDAKSPGLLEDAGFLYDSTLGYNEVVGFRAGTSQTFCPPGAERLLEVPLHIQDVALFYRSSLNLTEDEAEQVCDEIVRSVVRHGGVLTILWHLRSLGPERLWGDFYRRLLELLQKRRVWFATAGQVADWFRCRRAASFARDSDNHVTLSIESSEQSPDVRLAVRVYRPGSQAEPACRSSADYVELPCPAAGHVTVPLESQCEMTAHGV